MQRKFKADQPLRKTVFHPIAPSIPSSRSGLFPPSIFDILALSRYRFADTGPCAFPSGIDMNVLVINCGSSSIKYQAIDTRKSVPLAEGKVERLGASGSYEQALKKIAAAVTGHHIEAVGHRVVHGGERFSMPTIIDEEVLSAIVSCIPLAPLHNPANLAGIKAARRNLPDAPPRGGLRHRLPLPPATPRPDLRHRSRGGGPLNIRRYGFHGISHAYVARKGRRIPRNAVSASCGWSPATSATAPAPAPWSSAPRPRPAWA